MAMTPDTMSTYRILLQRPSFMGGGTFSTSVEADSPEAAVDAARLHACHADGVGEINPTDYAVLAIDLKPER